MGGSYSAPAEVRSAHFKGVRDALPSMGGKTVAITGCTTGTGFVLAKACVELGATVLMLNRPSERATNALKSLEALGAPGKAVAIDCDLMRFDSVRAAGEKLRKEYATTGIDVLCNNAGIMATKDKATVDGCDTQMQTNHLSHFLLTSEVWPLLERAAERNGEARVVNHSSGARKMGSRLLDEKYLGKNGGNLGGDDVTGYFKYLLAFTGPRWVRYQQTKLANVVFTYALHDKLTASGKTDKIKALVAHPGLSATNLQVSTAAEGGMGPSFTSVLMNRLSQSAEDGTLGILVCCCSPNVTSGEFYGPKSITGPAVLMAEETLATEESRKMLWEKSVEVTGAKFPF